MEAIMGRMNGIQRVSPIKKEVMGDLQDLCGIFEGDGYTSDMFLEERRKDAILEEEQSKRRWNDE
jgi:hypothetical protein